MSIEDRLVLLSDPNSPIAESYRSLRAALSRSLAKGKRKFAIVSSWGGEGKSMVSANLAVSLTQLLMDVVLIDGDLRRPTLSRVFEIEPLPGVLNVLEHGIPAGELVCETSIERLFVMPAGQSDLNPGNLLGTGRFLSVIEALDHDDVCVVIDTPPMSACSDALLMATHCDGAVMVVSPDKWHGEAEAHFVQDLEDYGIEVLGAVMNNAEDKEALPGSGFGNYGTYGQGYGQGYGQYGQEPEPPKTSRFSISGLFSKMKSKKSQK